MTQNTAKYRKTMREFLQIYRSEPCLWQIKNKLYYNRFKKNAALEKLAEKYREIDGNADRDTISKKINALRTTYKRERRKLEACKRSGVSYEPRLWYFEDLSFIDNQDDPFSSNLKKEEDDDMVQKEYIDVDDDHDILDSKNDSNNFIDSYISDDDIETNEVSVRTTRPKPKKRRRESRIDSVSQSIYDFNEHTKYRDENSNEDRHDVYCKYLACRLRDLPREQLVLAENLINNVLFQAEMGNLTLGYKVVDTVRNNLQYCPHPSTDQVVSADNSTQSAASADL